MVWGGGHEWMVAGPIQPHSGSAQGQLGGPAPAEGTCQTLLWKVIPYGGDGGTAGRRPPPTLSLHTALSVTPVT